MNLRELKQCIKTGVHPNHFYYKRKYYVLEEYDMEGCYMCYASAKAGKDIVILTPNNRYKKNFKDMLIEVRDKCAYRYDINYDEQ